MEMASWHEKLETVKYLRSIGIECTLCSIKLATKYKHYDVPEYLLSIIEIK